MHYVLAHDDGQAQPGSGRGGCRAGRRVPQLARRRPASIWPTAASRRPTCRWCRMLPLPPELETVEVPGGRPDPRPRGADRDPPPPAAADRRRQPASSRQNSTDYVDEDAVKAELLWARRLCNRARLAGDRRDPPLDRGDRGDRAATDGGLARAAAGQRQRSAAAGPVVIADRWRSPRRRADPRQRLGARRALLAAAGARVRADAGRDRRGGDQGKLPRPRACRAEDAAMPLAEAKAAARRATAAGGAGDRRRPDPGLRGRAGSTSRPTWTGARAAAGAARAAA